MTQKDALFADGSSDYIMPQEPEANQMIRFFFRTLRYHSARIHMQIREGTDTVVQSLPMGWDHAEGVFDYYVTEYRIGRGAMRYWFRVLTDQGEFLYDRSGAIEPTINEEGEKSFPEPLPLRLYPGFHVPDWSKGAVMYQIYTDRFCNGDPSNDVQTREYFYNDTYSYHVEDWYSDPAPRDVHRFYGGDIQGVWDKLDYLADLGVEVIYFNPLFVSPSNHKYDTQDYDHIDPHLTVIPRDGGALLEEGDRDNSHASRYRLRTAYEVNLEAGDAFFAEFIQAAHEKGIRVILDGVFNHCGSFHKWLNAEGIYSKEGAYNDRKSPYLDHIKFYGGKWPGNDMYEGWWDFKTLPKLNYEESEALCQEILRIGRKWVSPPFCADGWRLDVAADLGHSAEFNHRFWRRFREAVREANPDALVLAEHYGDCTDWLNGQEWDTIMNYDAFMEPVTYFLTGMEKHSDAYDPYLEGNSEAFAYQMTHACGVFPTPSYLCAMNELSNHDHSRFLTRTNHKVGRVEELGSHGAEEGVNMDLMLMGIVMQMTWPGAPTVYYGDEAGVCGFTDPDCRRTYPWGRENSLLLNFHRDMIRIHKKEHVLKEGSVLILNTDPELLSYGRFDKKEQLLVIVNRSTKSQTAHVPVWRMGSPMEAAYERRMLTQYGGYHTEGSDCYVTGGVLHYDMPPCSSVVLRRK